MSSTREVKSVSMAMRNDFDVLHDFLMFRRTSIEIET